MASYDETLFDEIEMQVNQVMLTHLQIICYTLL